MIAELAWPVVALVGIAAATWHALKALEANRVGEAWAERVERVDATARRAESTANGAHKFAEDLHAGHAKLSARMEALEAPRAVPQAVRR